MMSGISATFTFQAYVLDQLIVEEQKVVTSNWDPLNRMSKKQFLSFRLCMANVLISACQKISDSGKRPFALTILQRITRSVGVSCSFPPFLRDSFRGGKMGSWVMAQNVFCRGWDYPKYFRGGKM